ncbi:transcription initiation factor IIF, beta subunit [Crepidotus variabilis]|uniref:Transcription initiation factor IIF subunit beta n=1 Tax=Crepidotus variabilis TaxID=179855 RepID=A0A9P6ESI0_9AGAR|nr:transcription initiation factor IIF, beta subunit [Crepidotus variabilis]
MEEVMEEDKKPFEGENAQEDDSQPDPDEHLMLDQGNGKVWLVKIPKFLLERWTAVNVEDVHLATIRVYNPPKDGNGQPDGKTRIVLFLPPNRDPNNPDEPPRVQRSDWPAFEHTTTYAATGPEPDCYELDMVNDNVENQIVVAERPKDTSLSISTTSAASTASTRARTTILTGRIKHECNLRPALSRSYRKQMKERVRKSNTPLRQIRMIEDAGVAGGRGGINRLSSGVGVGAGSAFSDLVKAKQRPPKGAFERMARMPRNQLLDLLFTHFQEQPRWSIRPLREKTQQPEAYLKETLSQIAFLHKSGEFNGYWELQENYKTAGIKAENVPGPSTPGDMKMDEDDDEDEDEEDDDDDMEEVS